MKTIATFREAFEAHLACGKLKTEGIPAMVLDENMVNINWMYSQAIGGVKLEVPEQEAERARQILQEDHEQKLEATEESHLSPSPEEVCPNCGSSSTTLRPYSPWSLVPTFVFNLLILIRRPGRLCKECGAVWKGKK